MYQEYGFWTTVGFIGIALCAIAKLFGLLKLRDKYDQWWYFLDHPEVLPDNNLAERSLRLAVTKRKVSGGVAIAVSISKHSESFDGSTNVSKSGTFGDRLLCVDIAGTSSS
jgi:hypothetical protein